MSAIEDCIKNVEMAITELKAALQSENVISVTNQKELTTEELLFESNIRL